MEDSINTEKMEQIKHAFRGWLWQMYAKKHMKSREQSEKSCKKTTEPELSPPPPYMIPAYMAGPSTSIVYSRDNKDDML